MPHRSSLLPALVALAATAAPALMAASSAAADTTASTTTVHTTSAVARVTAAEGDEPLRVSLDTLAPAYVPEQGKLRLTGTVTNLSDERWRAIKVYVFIDDVPMTTSAELAATADTPVDAEVGKRIIIAGTFDDIGGLAPGETSSYTISLKRSQLPVSQPGVYWFGTHALGNTTEARDLVADGRARTLLPLVPEDASGTEKASVVVPLRHSIRHVPDGRLRSANRWATDLAGGGRLRQLLDFGAASGPNAVTWLVDPAVPDAVARLVDGNRPRTIADVLPAPGDPTDPTDPADPTDGESPGESGGPDPTTDSEIVDPGDGDGGGNEEDVPSNPATVPGASWLDRLEEALQGQQVLTLPYGDPDVAAAQRSAPQLYDRAVRRSGTQLDEWRVRSEPAVAPPDGYLPTDALPVLGGDETVILSDRALGEGGTRGAGRLGDQRLLFSSSAAALGGPAPGEGLDEVALRQRFVAEAAVRLLFHERTPLLLVIPDSFVSTTPEAFWEGLDEVPWLRLSDTGSLGGATPLADDALLYPVDQELTELDPENFVAAENLISAGSTLDNVLPRNDLVATRAVDEALTSLSYSERTRALEARVATDAAATWMTNRLEQVRLRAPRGVTLSGTTNDFFTTVVNRLDHPVTVRITSVSLGSVDVEQSDPIELAPGGRQTVLLTASVSAPGVHYVRVMVTDEAGTPLGASQRVAIRSAEVSQVIWLILGVGVGLLFLAIAIRLVRRVRRERA